MQAYTQMRLGCVVGVVPRGTKALEVLVHGETSLLILGPAPTQLLTRKYVLTGNCVRIDAEAEGVEDAEEAGACVGESQKNARLGERLACYQRWE